MLLTNSKPRSGRGAFSSEPVNSIKHVASVGGPFRQRWFPRIRFFPKIHCGLRVLKSDAAHPTLFVGPIGTQHH